MHAIKAKDPTLTTSPPPPLIHSLTSAPYNPPTVSTSEKYTVSVLQAHIPSHNAWPSKFGYSLIRVDRSVYIIELKASRILDQRLSPEPRKLTITTVCQQKVFQILEYWTFEELSVILINENLADCTRPYNLRIYIFLNCVFATILFLCNRKIENSMKGIAEKVACAFMTQISHCVSTARWIYYSTSQPDPDGSPKPKWIHLTPHMSLSRTMTMEYDR